MIITNKTDLEEFAMKLHQANITLPINTVIYLPTKEFEEIVGIIKSDYDNLRTNVSELKQLMFHSKCGITICIALNKSMDKILDR